MASNISTPQAIEAEKAALGSVLSDERAASLVCSSLIPADFVEMKNRLVFESMLRLFLDRKPIDPTTIVTDMETHKVIDDAGGSDYLFELVQSCINPDNASFYVRIIRDHSRLKNYILSIDGVLKKYARGEVEDPSSFIAETKPQIDEAAIAGSSEGFKPIGAVADAVLNQVTLAKESGKGTVTGIDTGFPSLNAITHGFHKNDLIIIAGRPSMGKTALAGNIVSAVGKNGGVVAFISLEMTPEQVVKRLCSPISGVPLDSLETGNLTAEEYQKAKDATSEIKRMKVFFDDASTGLAGDVVASVSRIKANNPDLSLVVIDYLGLMKTAARMESRQIEVASITRSLKRLARTLDVSIVALCQLNREIEEKSEGARPTMANLRESGAIEQDADVVILIHRPDYYTSRKAGTKESYPSVAELIVAKNRNGGTGIARTYFYGDKCLFVNASDKIQEGSLSKTLADNERKRKAYQNGQTIDLSKEDD